MLTLSLCASLWHTIIILHRDYSSIIVCVRQGEWMGHLLPYDNNQNSLLKNWKPQKVTIARLRPRENKGLESPGEANVKRNHRGHSLAYIEKL